MPYDVKFTEKNPPADELARVLVYKGVTSRDIVSDPMTINCTATGFDDAGDTQANPYNRSFAKVDWTGEDL